MKKENGNPVGASPPAVTFAHALGKFQAADAALLGARLSLEQAQTAFETARSELPVPELMQGPVVRVTDKDSLRKVSAILRMTIGDRAGAKEAVRLFDQVKNYRERLYGIERGLMLQETADATFDALSDARIALDRLLVTAPATLQQLYDKMATIHGSAGRFDMDECVAFFVEDARRLCEGEA